MKKILFTSCLISLCLLVRSQEIVTFYINIHLNTLTGEGLDNIGVNALNAQIKGLGYGKYKITTKLRGSDRDLLLQIEKRGYALVNSNKLAIVIPGPEQELPEAFILCKQEELDKYKLVYMNIAITNVLSKTTASASDKALISKDKNIQTKANELKQVASNSGLLTSLAINLANVKDDESDEDYKQALTDILNNDLSGAKLILNSQNINSEYKRLDEMTNVIKRETLIFANKLNLLGDIQLLSGDFGAALEYYTMTNKLQSNNINVISKVIYLYSQFGNITQVAFWMAKAQVVETTNDTDRYQQLIISIISLLMNKEATENMVHTYHDSLSQFVDIDRNHRAAAQFALGLAISRFNIDTAMAYLNSAAKIGADNKYIVLSTLITTYLQTEDYAKADSLFSERDKFAEEKAGDLGVGNIWQSFTFYSQLEHAKFQAEYLKKGKNKLADLLDRLVQNVIENPAYYNSNLLMNGISKYAEFYSSDEKGLEKSLAKVASKIEKASSSEKNQFLLSYIYFTIYEECEDDASDTKRFETYKKSLLFASNGLTNDVQSAWFTGQIIQEADFDDSTIGLKMASIVKQILNKAKQFPDGKNKDLTLSLLYSGLTNSDLADSLQAQYLREEALPFYLNALNLQDGDDVFSDAIDDVFDDVVTYYESTKKYDDFEKFLSNQLKICQANIEILPEPFMDIPLQENIGETANANIEYLVEVLKNLVNIEFNKYKSEYIINSVDSLVRYYRNKAKIDDKFIPIAYKIINGIYPSLVKNGLAQDFQIDEKVSNNFPYSQQWIFGQKDSSFVGLWRVLNTSKYNYLRSKAESFPKLADQRKYLTRLISDLRDVSATSAKSSFVLRIRLNDLLACKLNMDNNYSEALTIAKEAIKIIDSLKMPDDYDLSELKVKLNVTIAFSYLASGDTDKAIGIFAKVASYSIYDEYDNIVIAKKYILSLIPKLNYLNEDLIRVIKTSISEK